VGFQLLAQRLEQSAFASLLLDSVLRRDANKQTEESPLYFFTEK
jgi:hypothetical protein